MHWTDIKRGQEWLGKRSERRCIVENAPTAEAGYVKVLHSSGRRAELRPYTLLRDYRLSKAAPAQPD